LNEDADTLAMIVVSLDHPSQTQLAEGAGMSLAPLNMKKHDHVNWKVLRSCYSPDTCRDRSRTVRKWRRSLLSGLCWSGIGRVEILWGWGLLVGLAGVGSSAVFGLLVGCRFGGFLVILCSLDDLACMLLDVVWIGIWEWDGGWGLSGNRLFLHPHGQKLGIVFVNDCASPL